MSCGPSPEYLRSLNRDFFTTGFLNSDLYQAVIKGSPDENVKGLVARRESARMNAISDLENQVLQKLYGEWKMQHGNDLEDIPEEQYRGAVTAELSTFVYKGRVVEKYYNQDHSISLVYRIHGNNLRSKIQSISVPSEITGKGEKKDATSS